MRTLLASAGAWPDEGEVADSGGMPSDVAQRVAATLADAARLRVAPGPLTAAERAGNVSPFVGRPTRRGPWMAVAAVAAAVAVIAVGGSALHVNKRSNGEAALGDTRRITPTTAQTSAPLNPATVHVQRSDTAYAAGNLAERARELLERPGPQLEPTASTLPSIRPVGTPAGLSSCLSALKVTDASAVSVDLATFDGSPAAVIVVTREVTTNAWVVARTCAAGDPGVIKAATEVP